MKFKALTGLLAAAAISCSAFATQLLDSPDVHLMITKAHELEAQYGKSNVLLVYDIDNTLLTANQDLGSDQWFNWQAGLLSSGNLHDAVAPDFPGLIDVQGLLFTLEKMHPVDTDSAKVYNDLQSEGFATLLLTSRGTNNRDATSRELARNGFNQYLDPLDGHGVAGQFLPYDPQHLDRSGLSDAEAKAMGLGAPQPVTLVDGLLMTSGQHKGAMLRTVLYSLHQNYKAILFIDDTPKNVTRMHDAFDGIGVDVVSIRYAKMDGDVKRFELSDKTPVIAAWLELKQAIGDVFH
jgi:hypothetical protein